MKPSLKNFLLVVAIVGATCNSTMAQSLAGTWQVEGLGKQPWSAVLVPDGSRLTGSVRTCAAPPDAILPAAISDGTIVGNTLRFTCTNLDGTRTFAFIGQINGDDITFTYREQTLPEPAAGAPPDVTGLFGSASPRSFVARRVREGGTELAASANLVRIGAKVEGALFLPRGIARVRSVMVLVNPGTSWNGLAASVYTDADIRTLAATLHSGLLLLRVTPIESGPYMYFVTNANAAGDEGLLQLLEHLATDSGHLEIRDVPLLFWGHSAAGPFGTTFALAHPERTIAFVRYHSGNGGILGADMEILKRTPALFLQAASDDPLGETRIEELWRRGRAVGAPWTFGIEPDATHQNPADVKKANALLIPWITAVLTTRRPADSGPLRPVVANASSSNWLPDEASATGWRAVTGASR